MPFSWQLKPALLFGEQCGCWTLRWLNNNIILGLFYLHRFTSSWYFFKLSNYGATPAHIKLRRWLQTKRPVANETPSCKRNAQLMPSASLAGVSVLPGTAKISLIASVERVIANFCDKNAVFANFCDKDAVFAHFRDKNVVFALFRSATTS